MLAENIQLVRDWMKKEIEATIKYQDFLETVSRCEEQLMEEIFRQLGVDSSSKVSEAIADDIFSDAPIETLIQKYRKTENNL